MSLWRTIKSYILWTHERGTIHYDVMVTLILLFIFVGPRFVDFRDKPTERVPHPTGVVEIIADGAGGLLATVDARTLGAEVESDTEAALRRVIEPISGDVRFDRIEPVKDGRGRVVSYKAWVTRK